MPQPTPYNRLYNFTDWQTVNPSKPLPATELDGELNAVKLTTDQLRANAALIQRDDGRLANQSVTPESFSAGALAIISQGQYSPRGAWASATGYAAGDVVEFNLATYLAVAAHTSDSVFATDLAAGRWLLLANAALSGGAQAVDLFAGDATTTQFTLSFIYSSVNSVRVFVNGVAQVPTQDYAILADEITFVVAPPAPSVPGTNNVMVWGTAVEAQIAASQATTAEANAQQYAAAALASEIAAAASEVAAQAAATDPNVVAVGTNIASVNTVAGNTTNINTVAGISGNVTTVATNNANVTSVANNSSNINTVATNSSNVTTVASNIANVNTTATNIASVNTTATNIASVNTAAANITDIQNASGNAAAAAASASAAAASYDDFDDRYLGAKTADPATDNDGDPLVAGALYFNTSAGVMKVYSGSAWTAAFVSGTDFLPLTGGAVTADTTFNGVRIGRGSGNISTNTTVGSQALDANSSGANNAAFGRQALRKTTTGGGNTAVGNESLVENTTGASSTAVGYGALYNSIATGNTAVGQQAGVAITSGASNTAVGNTALYNNQTGDNNTAVGASALFNATGTQNLALGYFAASQLTTGSKNVVVGSYDGNSGGLDIRTSNNHVVLSDGDGNPRLAFNGSGSAVVRGNLATTDQAETLTNKTLTNPTVTNYVETLYAPSANTAFTVDLANGTVQLLESSGNLTITLPSAAAGKSVTIIVKYGGTHTLTWAGGGTLKWAGGVAPTATSANGKFDIFNFYSDGTNTYGSVFGLNF